MGQFELEDPESRKRIVGWRNQPGMMGLRWALLYPDQQKALHEGKLDWVWPAAEKEGVPVATMAGLFLGPFRKIAEAHPRLKLIIDHCGLLRLEKDAADARIVVFSATAANSTAAELPELGHGVFTYSVLQGLRGAANTGGDGVRLLGLADFIYREVTKLTNSRQKPFYYISSMENILLAQP